MSENEKDISAIWGANNIWDKIERDVWFSINTDAGQGHSTWFRMSIEKTFVDSFDIDDTLRQRALEYVF